MRYFPEQLKQRISVFTGSGWAETIAVLLTVLGLAWMTSPFH